MNSLRQTKKSSRTKYTIVALAILFAIGVGVYAFMREQGNSSEPQNSTDTFSQNLDENTSIDSTDPVPEEKQAAAEANNSDVDTTLAPEDVPVSENVTAAITRAEQRDMVVYYDATITGTTSGTCSAVFTSQHGKPVSKTSSLQNGRCSQQINAVEFDALGEWQLTLRFYTDNTQATDTAKVMIR